MGHSATSDLIKNDVIFECNETVLKQQEILKREIQDCLQMLSKVKIWIQVAPSGARAPHSFPAPRGMIARPARTLPEMTPRPYRFFPLHPRRYSDANKMFLPQLRAQVEEYGRQLEERHTLRQLRLSVNELKRGYAWSLVTDAEDALEKVVSSHNAHVEEHCEASDAEERVRPRNVMMT